MAKQLITSGVTTGQTIEAGHVTQSSVAFTGGEAYDITISGSLTVTGSTDINGVLSIPGFPDVSSSLANSGGGGVGFPFTGSAKITGSLELTGSYNVLASEGSNLSLEINESASFQFLTGAPNTGSFIVQSSPDTGKGALQSFFGQGTGTVFGQPLPNHIFGVKYTTGSNASEGELTMTIGKRDLSGFSSVDMNNFYVAYEPGGIFTNAQGELEFFVGEHPNVGSGVILQHRGGASGTTQTSSFAGYFSSSAFPNQQQYTRPFVISNSGGPTLSDSNPAFVINKNITDLTTSNFSVDYGGNVTATHITASGNISASGDIRGNTLRVGVTADNATGLFISSSTFDGDSRDAQIIYPSHGLHFNSDISNNHVLALAGNNVGVRIQPDSGNTALTVSGSINVIEGNITASGNISASGDITAVTASLQRIELPDNSSIVASPAGHKLEFGASELKLTSGDDIFLQLDDTITFANADTTIPGNITAGGTISNVSTTNVTASGHGLFQAGKPISSSLHNFTASISNAGFYHTVGGNLTCSISTSTAPIGAEYEFFQTSSAGNFLFETGSGITLISKNDSLRLAQLGSSAVLKKITADTFHLMGDLT